MISVNRFYFLLNGYNYNFFTGVPCSTLSQIILNLAKTPGVSYIPAVREDIAIGLASGAHLAGKKPVVFMQNSGLGHSINALTSLDLVYEIPLLLIVSWRGFKGKDAPQHSIMGKNTTNLLEAIEVPYTILTETDDEDKFKYYLDQVDGAEIPYVFLLRKGVLR